MISYVGDHVTFSSRAQILVSKLGRSSKPSPRFLVLVRWDVSPPDELLLTPLQTEKALHIAVMNSQGGQNVLTLERKINLVTIKSVSMSNLRDDWFVSPC